MVGPDGALPLPWLSGALKQALGMHQAHALLLHGPQGVGQFELAVTLAQSWLCDAAPNSAKPVQACGKCASCKLAQARSHPDLLVVLPEALRESLGWLSDANEPGAVEKAGKAKPSKEIKVDSVRAVVAFSQTTSARGRGKAVVVHPAERMNAIAANTLLKTLEEPPGDTRFLLSSAAADALLPTVRSRCQSLPLGLPDRTLALGWLQANGVARGDVLLAGAGGQPQQALEWSQQGIDADAWLRLPQMVRRGESDRLADWPLPRLVEALQKLCHDSMRIASGAEPRYFPAAALGPAADMTALHAWSRVLNRASRHGEHPWHMALMVESLVSQAQQALSITQASGHTTPVV
jgi:DNA polymerase-3 subunit delta'